MFKRRKNYRIGFNRLINTLFTSNIFNSNKGVGICMTEIILPIKCSTVKKLHENLLIIITYEILFVGITGGLNIFISGIFEGYFLKMMAGIVFIFGTCVYFEKLISVMLDYFIEILEKILAPIEKILKLFLELIFEWILRQWNKIPSLGCVKDEIRNNEI
jgi:hypothetical protein